MMPSHGLGIGLNNKNKKEESLMDARIPLSLIPALLRHKEAQPQVPLA